VKTETATGDIVEIVFEAVRHAAKCHVPPGDVCRPYQANLEALFARRMVCGGEASAIEKMDLVYMRDADHREWCIDNDFCACFLEGFPGCGFGSGFTIFHEPGWEGPVADAWLDCPPAKKNSVFPRRDATHHQSGIFIVNVAAAFADVSGKGVARRYLEGNVGAAVRAELDHRIDRFWMRLPV